MKTSLKKFRGFSLHKHDAAKERRDVRPLAKLDELALASQDMKDMRDCYDSLLSAAAATANSAFEFSESLREMGTCLLEKTALNDDEEIGKVLLMLGKVQFELQKLVDSYRSHIFQTITSPSESLLNELRTVEEMKRQCDEKKSVYEYMLSRQREKGRSRRGESISPKQLQAALDEYDEEATLFVFRLKSLKSGQSRSLLTQAARHHAAQLHFFKKALMSLEMVEPHVKSVTEQQHINYQFSGLDDDDDMKDNENDDDDDEEEEEEEESDASQGEGELSFDYGQNEFSSDAVSKSRTSMEVDQVDVTFPRVSSGEPPKEFSDRSRRNSFGLSGDTRTSSYSAPLFAENKSETSERPKQLQPSATRKLYTYVLPTPDDTKGSGLVGSTYVYPPMRRTSLTGSTTNLWHSSPLEQKKSDKVSGDEHLSEISALNLPSVLKESNYNHTATNHVLPPLSETLKSSQFEPHASNTKKIRRYAFSGPLSSKPPSSKPYINDPMASTEYHRLFSGPISQSRLSRSSVSPKASPCTSPPFISSPIISEPHELPRPPVSLTSNYQRSSDVLGHSAPIVLRNRDYTVMNKLGSSASASPLPLPPQTLNMPRSFSIPSSSSRGTELYVSKALEPPNNSPIIEDVSSPPLTPISLSTVVQTPSVTLATTESNQNKGIGYGFPSTNITRILPEPA